MDWNERLYRNQRHWEEARKVDGIMIFRFDGPLHFANRDVFLTSLWRELRAHEDELNGIQARTKVTFWRTLKRKVVKRFKKSRRSKGYKRKKHASPVEVVVLDFSAVTHVDITGARALVKLREELFGHGTRLFLAHCRSNVHKMLVDTKLFEPFAEGEDFDVVCFCELHDAVLVAEGRHPLAPMEIDDADKSDKSQNPSESEQDELGEAPTLQRELSLSDALCSKGISLGHDDIGQHEPVSPCKPLSPCRTSTADQGVGDNGELLPGEMNALAPIYPKRTPDASIEEEEKHL